MKLSDQKRTIIFIMIGIAIILSLNFFQKEVKGFFYSISSPIQKRLWVSGSGNSNFLQAIFKAPDLERENKAFQLMIQELLSEQSRLKDLEEENKMLRQALNLGLQDEFRLELAEVTGKDVNRDSIIINKGYEDGVSKGLFVITPQKVMIGAIAEVYQKYSRVLLISAKESSLEAEVSQSSASGLVKGLGGFRIFLDLVPKDKEIKEGDLVVSGKFSVGLVKEVKKIDVNPFQGAEISPFFDISDLNKVFVALDF